VVASHVTFTVDAVTHTTVTYHSAAITIPTAFAMGPALTSPGLDRV